MTLIKSLLLGSAAGILAVASAQAADLPTKKGAPAVEYVKVCKITVAGKPVIGFTLPGSDTCMHFTGYITGQIEGGNLETGYSYGNYANGYNEAPATSKTTVVGPTAAGNTYYTSGAAGNNFTAGVAPVPPAPAGTAVGLLGPSTQATDATGKALTGAALAAVAPRAGMGTQSSTASNTRDSFGFTTRLNFGFDAVSNTAAGPLVAHAEMQFENGSGFDNTGNAAYINLAYVTWAGITAGKAPSFFSFTGGGAGWANFFSPDQKGFNQPDVLAYTASTGGGFSATLAIQSQGTNGNSGGGTLDGVVDGKYLGKEAPDIVAALALSQAWGSAQISGVAHEVHATNGWTSANTTTWGWAMDAGLSFNLPSGAGDQILITGAWSYDATWYSGLNDAMWGENGAVNGNGQAMFLDDIAANSDGSWSNPTAWSVTAEFDHHFNPQVTVSLEGSVGGISYSNQIFSSDVSNSTSWLIGGIGHYAPVAGLDFEFELLYQDTHTNNPNSASAAKWNANADGVAARFEVTRSW